MMPDLAARLRTIRDGLHAGCTVDELTVDLESLISRVEIEPLVGPPPGWATLRLLASLALTPVALLVAGWLLGA